MNSPVRATLTLNNSRPAQLENHPVWPVTDGRLCVVAVVSELDDRNPVTRRLLPAVHWVEVCYGSAAPNCASGGIRSRSSLRLTPRQAARCTNPGPGPRSSDDSTWRMD